MGRVCEGEGDEEGSGKEGYEFGVHRLGEKEGRVVDRGLGCDIKGGNRWSRSIRTKEAPFWEAERIRSQDLGHEFRE